MAFIIDNDVLKSGLIVMATARRPASLAYYVQTMIGPDGISSRSGHFMPLRPRLPPGSRKGVALVDGNPVVRRQRQRQRQLLLWSEAYDVRSYATSAALLADVRANMQARIVVDVGMREGDGLSFLRAMRASAWRGRAMLDGADPDGSMDREAGRNGDQLRESKIADRSLLMAIDPSFFIGKRQADHRMDKEFVE